MADEKLNLLDVAKMNSSDREIGLIEEVATHAPEARVVAARSIRGTSYKTLHRTALPTTGFRSVNKGFPASKSKFELRNVECFVLGGKVVCDRSAADACEDGKEYYQALEASGVMESAMITLGNQFYYGNVEESGFPGLQSLVDSSMVHDATGSTADTGSSVYGVRFGEKNLQFVNGQGGGFSLGDFREESVEDADGNTFDAYVSYLNAWVGLQATNKYCVGRIKNITTQTGKMLDDEMLFKWLELFPSSRMPDAIFLNRRSLGQLRASRTATNATGAPAPFPTDVDGIPIVVTDSITSTEAIA